MRSTEAPKVSRPLFRPNVSSSTGRRGLSPERHASTDPARSARVCPSGGVPRRRSLVGLPAGLSTGHLTGCRARAGVSAVVGLGVGVAAGLALAGAALLLTGIAVAGDWPTVGGNSLHNGQSSEVGPTGAELLWQGTVNALFGGQCYTEGDRLVTWRFQSISVAPIVCYDLESGDPQWSVDFGGTNSRSVPRGMRDGRVYATNFQETQADTLIALDKDTGSRAWVSPVRMPLGIIWSACFAPDGDLVIPCVGDDIARIDAGTGQQVWIAPRIIPNTGAEHLCVFGNTVYGFEGSITTPKTLTAWDLTSGQKKYSSPALAGDGDQEIPLSMAPDGTVYVKRDGGPLYALVDDGASLSILWQRPINAGFYSGHIGIGVDGSLYLPDGQQLVRLDPATGAELDRSANLVTSSTLNPRFAVGADGTLYVGNGGSGDGRLYALAPNLQELWSVSVPGMVYGGPALGSNGSLAVAGNGTTLRVYRSAPSSVSWEEQQPDLRLICAPNPIHESAVVGFQLPRTESIWLHMVEPGGRIVRTLIAGEPRAAGWQEIALDGRDGEGRRLPVGTYFLRLQAESGVDSRRVLVIR